MSARGKLQALAQVCYAIFMGKFFLLTLGGFLLFGSSMVLGYFYLNALSSDTNPWYLLVTIVVCITLSAVCMIFASNIKNPFFTSDLDNEPLENDPSITTTGLQNAVEKNNLLVSQWRKTNHMRDKMKMIKVTTSSQSSSQKSRF